jgi:hypothetical protein
MGIWGDVISQLRLDILDTPLVTVHLQRHDDRFYRPTRRAPIHNH